MKIYTIHRQLAVPHPLAVVFDFFSRVENLERITPPWLHFRILSPLPIEMKAGALISYSLRVRGIPLRWLTKIEEWNPPFEFIDVQSRGPYNLWRHKHRFSTIGDGTFIEDIVQYALPFGVLGRIANRLQVARDLAHVFDYRAQRVQALLG